MEIFPCEMGQAFNTLRRSSTHQWRLRRHAPSFLPDISNLITASSAVGDAVRMGCKASFVVVSSETEHCLPTVAIVELSQVGQELME